MYLTEIDSLLLIYQIDVICINLSYYPKDQSVKFSQTNIENGGYLKNSILEIPIKISQSQINRDSIFIIIMISRKNLGGIELWNTLYKKANACKMMIFSQTPCWILIFDEYQLYIVLRQLRNSQKLLRTFFDFKTNLEWCGACYKFIFSFFLFKCEVLKALAISLNEWMASLEKQKYIKYWHSWIRFSFILWINLNR